ncbi:MAG: glycosyltransferase family 2 protein, partial [Bacteroidetes bacterium]|nr:glycosyltransferase family 2 protein [Bacteroidota bacterium]
MNTPTFSVIIPTFNRQVSLRACLHALAEQTLDPSAYEVIVAIDGSADGTESMLSEFHAPFQLRTLVLEHRGASQARNAGAEAARGEYLAFTEDDVIPDPYWLAHAHKHIMERTLDILEGRTVYTHSRSNVRRFEPHGIPSYIPCNLFVRRQVFRAVGGYAPDFFDGESGLYFREDSDLGFRL